MSNVVFKFIHNWNTCGLSNLEQSAYLLTANQKLGYISSSMLELEAQSKKCWILIRKPGESSEGKSEILRWLSRVVSYC